MPHSPSPTPSGSPRANDETSLLDLENTQNGLVRGRDRALARTAHEVWRPGQDILDLRESRTQALQEMGALSASGTQTLVDALAAGRANERLRQQYAADQAGYHRAIVSGSLAAFRSNLDTNLAESRMMLHSGISAKTVLEHHLSQNKMIAGSAGDALSAIGDTFRQSYEFMNAARENRAADASLFFDMLERNMRIQETLLAGISREFEKECRFKFKTIRKAIEFVQRVQEEMSRNSEMIEAERDKESRRQLRARQEEAATLRVMRELEMSQEAARRAADLLERKEVHLNRVKMEELSIQRSRERMDHERRARRYFSVWGFLFG